MAVMEKERDTLISAEENRDMFDRIASRYDLTNRAISLGMDRRWRRKAVGHLRPFRGGRYLDVGTGTGDLVFEILRQSANVIVDAIDPSERMLELARKKAEHKGVGDSVSFQTGDAMALATERNTYDGIVSGFCFRNIEDRQQALYEMFRVLKPGGRAVILEATYPENPVVRWGYNLYTPLVLLIGKLGGGGKAYRYLIDSIDDFPVPATVVGMFESAGFREVHVESLAMGATSIFWARRPG